MVKYIYRHIIRAPAKSLLGMAVTLFFTFVLGVLLNTTASLWAEIDRLYDETIVYAEIRLEENFLRSRRVAGDIISILIKRDILDMDIVQQMYLEGSSLALLANSPSELYDVGELEIFFGICDLRSLTNDIAGFLSRSDPVNMQVNFAPNLDEDAFVHDIDVAIPMVISQKQATRLNLVPGDSAYIIYYRPVLFRPGSWHYMPAMVLGVHDGGGLANFAHEGAVIPLSTMEYMLGDLMGYPTVKFAIDPAFNRDLESLSEELGLITFKIRYPRLETLAADIWDHELRFGVASLEQHAMLLELLFPIIAVISAIIGAALAMLTMLQNAKNAATIRVLGMSMLKTQLMLWVGQMLICIVGALLGLLLTVAIGSQVDLILVAMPYVVGALVGATAGAIIITSRAPLDLLQVKD